MLDSGRGKQANALRPSLRTIVVASICIGATALTWLTLSQQFGGIAASTIAAALRAQSASHVVGALALTALSFAALATYDWLAVRVVAPGRVGPATALLAGASANAISNTLGFHAFTGSAVRARIYMRRGLSAAETARIISLSWFALGLGFLTMLALAQFVQPEGSRGIGGATAVCLLALLAWLARKPRELRFFGFRQPLPSAALAATQMIIGAVETAAAVGALYVLLPADLAPSFSHFAVGCIAAVAAGLIAHAPGGIGVFEATITAFLSGAGRADLLAALLLYRAIYNLLPFVVSVVVLAVLAVVRRRAFSSMAGSD